MDARRLGAEFIGTFWLVLGGCGAAVLAGGEIGFHGVALAFGLSVLTGAYALGHISGGHFNPAVTLGLVAGKRFPAGDAVGYVISQVAGAVAAAAVIFVVASGVDGFEAEGGFAANGFDEFSPGGYSLLAALVIEVVLTAAFLVVIMGATRSAAPAGTAPVAIGLALTLIHLIAIPVTNTSVNPARSTSQALFAGTDLLAQLWVFWLAPIVGGIVGALVYRWLFGDRADDLDAQTTGGTPSPT